MFSLSSCKKVVVLEFLFIKMQMLNSLLIIIGKKQEKKNFIPKFITYEKI